MTDAYDLAGRALLGLGGGLTEDDRRAIRGAMDPFEPAGGGAEAPDVVLAGAGPAPAFDELHGPARDGLTTASAGGALFLLDGGSACRVPDALGDGPLTIGLHDGLGVGRIERPVLRPALQLAIARRGAAAVHAAAVELDGGAVLVAGWSETGKTEGALAFAERGARFLSDKWTVCDPDGVTSAFPIGVGVRRWVLPHLPTLGAALPAHARRRLAAAASLGVVSRPLRRGGRAGGLVDRFVTMADRAGLSPSEVRAAYGDASDPARRLPLRAVVLLRTVQGDRVTAAPVDPGWAAARLARSAAYERRPWFDLVERARYADPARSGEDSAAAWIALEQAVLARAFAGVPVIGVDAAFPTDPGRIVDAAMPHLR